MKVGLVVTVVYVALEAGSRYFTGHAASFHEVGVGAATLDLITGALDEAAAGIATVALTVGLAIPSLQGKPVVPKKENQDESAG